MGNKLLAAFVWGGALLAGSGVSSVHAAGESTPPWKSPWKDQPNVNLQTLINDGYEMVGGSFRVPGPGGDVEVLYPKKGKSLYRCATKEQKVSAQHGCEMLVSPEKSQ